MLSRRSSAGVAVLEGALYVAGGNDGTSCLNSVERYSPKAGAWESVAPMNIRRFAARGSQWTVPATTEGRAGCVLLGRLFSPLLLVPPTTSLWSSYPQEHA